MLAAPKAYSCSRSLKFCAAFTMPTRSAVAASPDQWVKRRAVASRGSPVGYCWRGSAKVRLVMARLRHSTPACTKLPFPHWMPWSAAAATLPPSSRLPSPGTSVLKRPVCVDTEPALAPLRMMLITPAMASEPYCAAAPSRRISMRSIIDAGMALRSAAAVPRPIVPLLLISALG
jgi:hypothetical protein